MVRWVKFQPHVTWNGVRIEMVTNLLTWEVARDACSNKFVFGTEKPYSTDEESNIISIGGTPKQKWHLLIARVPNNGWKGENCKPSSVTRGSMKSLAAFPTSTLMHRCQHYFHKLPKTKWNLCPCRYRKEMYRKEMFLQGGQILLPRGALER